MYIYVSYSFYTYDMYHTNSMYDWVFYIYTFYWFLESCWWKKLNNKTFTNFSCLLVYIFQINNNHTLAVSKLISHTFFTKVLLYILYYMFFTKLFNMAILNQNHTNTLSSSILPQWVFWWRKWWQNFCLMPKQLTCA